MNADANDAAEECSNVRCSREAVKQVRFIGIVDEPQGYCEEHHEELLAIQRGESDE